MTAPTTTRPADVDPFASRPGSTPSVSFKDAEVGTTYRLTVRDVPKQVQSRDYDTGEPAFWPAKPGQEAQPKMSIVIDVTDEHGEDKALWVPLYPAYLFEAIQAAQIKAGQRIAAGGTLAVTLTGLKPNENPRKHPAKLYSATYVPPAAGMGGDPFADTSTPPPAAAPQAAPAQQAAPAAAAPVAQPQAGAPRRPLSIPADMWADLKPEAKAATYEMALASGQPIDDAPF